MTLTPVDILHTQFKTAFKGYSKTQVDEFMHEVCTALEQAFKENSELKRRIDSLQEEVDRVRKIESTLSDTLVLAQKSADEIRAASHKQAEAVLKEADQARVQVLMDAQNSAEKWRSEIALLEATRDRFESEFKSLLISYMEWLEKRKCSDEAHAEVA